ncbi:ferritin-like domain-containing protein [Tumebacillus sp. ITR2]|uniref:Ferritin-like domain-containing protein n=1 Tax=Tumebacillus amylolyticus TaxID=2801339 RepID=A0ABS1J7B0_9BACL|nr:ferritin-like domain-containing protein [Tumebacillus amylolyticus]MBL0386144.1 ferritin-like domain-containing protein [Tumebacillus amylolyticus]
MYEYFLPRMPQPQHAAQPHFAAFQNQQEFLQMTARAIYNERQAQLNYRALYALAPTPFQKKMIQHALNDEIKHERMFTSIYQTLTGHAPQVPHPQHATVTTYAEGVRASFEDELEAAEMYRTMYLNTKLPWLRDRLFEIMTDEMEHAQRFTYVRADS